MAVRPLKSLGAEVPRRFEAVSDPEGVVSPARGRCHRFGRPGRAVRPLNFLTVDATKARRL